MPKKTGQKPPQNNHSGIIGFDRLFINQGAGRNSYGEEISRDLADPARIKLSRREIEFIGGSAQRKGKRSGVGWRREPFIMNPQPVSQPAQSIETWARGFDVPFKM